MDPGELAHTVTRRVGADEALAARIAEAVAAITARWPAAPLHAAFADHLAEQLIRRADLAIEDVFLAWWAGGAADGLAAFEAELGGELARVAARFPSLASDELLQQLRIKLFVGPAPKIRDYAGHGPLIGWVRVVAVRSFVDAARAARSRRYDEALDENELLGLPASAPRSEQLGAAVKRAFADAVARLAPRQRAFLRHAYVDHLTLDQIASTYCIHRATVARTLAASRAQLIEHTRAGVIAALGVPHDDLAAVIGSLDQRLELSLSRVLRAP